jgi:hypothetical protein
LGLSGLLGPLSLTPEKEKAEPPRALKEGRRNYSEVPLSFSGGSQHE